MEEINIKEFFIYLRRYIFAFVLVIALAVSGVVFYDTQLKKPVYQAHTTIVIAKSDSNDSAATTLNDVNASQKLTTTYSEIAKSELVLNNVVKNLNISGDVKQLSKNLTVQPVENTSILSVMVKDYDAKQAAAIANEIADVFAEEVTNIYKIDNVSQLSIAEAPTAPANNTLTRDIVLAVAISVFLVAGFAFLRFYLDDTVKHGDDVEKVFGLSVTGRVSRDGSKSKAKKKSSRSHKSNARTGNDSSELVVDKMPKSIVSENIKSLRTNLQFTAIDQNLKTILVTSTNAGEGKSFISSNLAISFAQTGKKVLLVDCDLRKGRVHRLFNILNTNGLSDLLTDNLKNIKSYVRDTGIENLWLITCGTYPPNPSELLASQKNKNLIEKLRDQYDIVIFDGAPVGGLADSVILSSFIDETLIITRDAYTSKSDLMATKSSLEKVGAKVAGVVFNLVNRKSSKYYSNYYYYGDSKKSK